jgi:chromate reductase
LPEGVTLEIFDLLGIPAYNQDLESDMPTKIKEFKSKIREESDAILIATPEYNFSVPGVLKNAIDWHQDHTVIIHLMVNQSLS